MIVCKRCGNHNESDDEFCGSCGVFLEWEGERIGESVATIDEPQPLPPPGGIVSRIKSAVLGEGSTLPPPGSGPAAALPAPSAHDHSSPGHAGLSHPPPRVPSAADQAASALSAKLPAPSAGPAPRQPTAQTPAAEVARPKPQTKLPPTRTINPGDLVCGTCGEPNSPDRNFCRRCGTTLAEIVPVRRRWWQRRSAGVATTAAGQAAGGVAAVPGTVNGAPAGANPRGGNGATVGGGGAGRGKKAKQGARKVKGGVFAGFSNVRRVIALLAIVGIGTGLAVPGLRSTITNKASDIYNEVKRKINPQYVEVAPDDTLSTASSSTPGHDATMIADGASNTIWLADPGDANPTVTMRFAPPTSLAKILITPGDQEKKENFKAQPRPKDVFVTAFDAAGTPLKTAQITLVDKADPQKFTLEAKNVVSVSVAVQSCYPDPAFRVCALTEIEFFKQK